MTEPLVSGIRTHDLLRRYVTIWNPNGSSDFETRPVLNSLWHGYLVKHTSYLAILGLASLVQPQPAFLQNCEVLEFE